MTDDRRPDNADDLLRIGDDLASIAAIAADPAGFEDVESLRRDLRELAQRWREERNR